MFELSQRFFFDAAHTLHTEVDAEGSRRIHGHTYHAEISVAGTPDRKTGMIADLGVLQQAIAVLRAKLDHHLLDEVQGMGPPTLENLCLFVWRELAPSFPGLSCVIVERQASGNRCVYRPRLPT